MSMSDTTRYLCTLCKGPIHYDIESQSWKCTYCFSKYTKEELESIYPKEDTSETSNKDEASKTKINEEYIIDSYKCSNCGAEVLADSETSATFCLYCKSPAIIKSRFKGEFEPRYLIPFKMKKEEIQRRYSEWIQKKKFAPDSFKYKEEIDKITGLYVPFWLFDSLAKGSIVSDCTKVRNWSDSNYNYTETKYYKVTRKGEGYYTKVPIDGLSDLEDSLVKKIEPFNYKEMVDFSMGYMAGFLAEKYNVPSDEAETEVRKRIDVFLEDSLKDTINGYNSSTILSKNFNIDIKQKNYALLPIYILTNEYNGVQYKFVANGQTGKIYGIAPMVKFKIVKAWLLIYLISTLIVGLGGAFIAKFL